MCLYLPYIIKRIINSVYAEGAGLGDGNIKVKRKTDLGYIEFNY